MKLTEKNRDLDIDEYRIWEESKLKLDEIYIEGDIYWQ
jgi:hypothetical protein